MYGSPQLGPFREDPRRRSRRYAIGAVLSFSPLWRRILPWRPVQRLLATVTTLCWVTVAVGAVALFSRTVPFTSLKDQARSVLKLDATPTFTAQQRQYLSAIADQQQRDAATATSSNSRSPRGPVAVALTTSECRSSAPLSLMTCRGTVRNISGQDLRGVVVAIEWLDSRAVSQVTYTGPIDYDPLLPEQESPWTVISRYNPALVRYRVRFQTTSGAEINYDDERPPPP